MSKKLIGLIINPIAGIGGRVGLKGSDSIFLQQRAYELGAKPLAISRTIETLTYISGYKEKAKFITFPEKMGAFALERLGFEREIIGEIYPDHTTAEDTRRAARLIATKGVDLLVFSGGDGTARDIYDAIGMDIQCLGIPAGVKIHSPVYAINPFAAGQLLIRYLEREKIDTREAEVIDLDEDAYREGIVKTRLYGYLKILYVPQFIQGGKVSSHQNARSKIMEIASYIVENMVKDVPYILGPGTTTKAITDYLGLQKTLIGVDIIINRQFLKKDVGETELLDLLSSVSDAKIIVTPIGGQGFIFGRGNQQISPQIIRRVGRENIWIISTLDKIISLKGRPLLLDTGDYQLDMDFRGYWKVIIGYNEFLVYRVT
ncbi:MAG: ATP-NAD kinase family protein [Candidatus Kryptoniota bacterium]